jgi:hypothetical protein
VAKSNWYVFNPQKTWLDADLLSNRRIFGAAKPYLLVIHLGIPKVLQDDYQLAYTYTATHRLAANVQNLQSAVGLFTGISTRAAGGSAPPPPIDQWALGSIEANPPSDIVITGAITHGGKTVNLDTATQKFNDEGLYRWDISIGVPILSYKTLQDVVSNNSMATLAAVDKRNSLVLGNYFFKPVDIAANNFLSVPHLVGGVSIASKPLHAAVVGLGIGPSIANLYVGALILTDNLPNHKTDHHYKLAFGLNVPIRAVADKLGIKSQIN